MRKAAVVDHHKRWHPAEQDDRRMLRGIRFPPWLLGAAKPPSSLAVT